MTELPMLQMAPPPAPRETDARGPGARRFRIAGMDCGSCASTLEKVVLDLDGVEAAQVSFGNATLALDGEASDEAVHAAVRRAGFVAHEAGPRRPAGSTAPFWRQSVRSASTSGAIVLLAVAVLASMVGAPRLVAEPLYLLSMAVGGWPIVLAAATALRRRSLDMNVLMSLAALGAVAIGSYAEGAWVLVLFAVGTTLESFALERSRRSVEQLMELAPAEAHLLVAGKERTVPVDDVPHGALLAVRPGERLPLDGVLVEGDSSVDESALTGESIPVEKGPGAELFAGTLNAFGAFTMRTTSGVGDSTLARIAQLVSDAQGSRAPSERFVDRFARSYTPLVLVAAILVAVVGTLAGGTADTWIYRGLALLIVACPCALVISVPVGVVSAIGGAARRGVLIKSGQALEDLGRIRVVALDKTGTLTEGRPRLMSTVGIAEGRPRTTSEVASGGERERELLALMAAVERGSEHPLATAIARAAREAGVGLPAANGFLALPGRGAVATVDGRKLWAGGPRLAAEHGAALPEAIHAAEARGETAVLLGEGRRVLAVFGLADRPRPEAADAVRALRGAGVAPVMMLTGDSEPVARAVARKTGIEDWRAGLLPEDKLELVRTLQKEHGTTAMLGDGINDAPALAAASVGIAMGAAGSDVALETADVALMGDELQRFPEAILHGRRALLIMRQNVAISLITKAIFVVLAPFGLVTLVVAVAADMGISLLVTLNGLRLMRMRTSAA